MSLIKCKECGHSMSSTAPLCPNCGWVKPKSTPVQTLIGFVILIGLFFGAKSCCSSMTDSSNKAQSDHPKTLDDLINDQFSAWDGSHILLKKMIKAGMNDPESFEHVSTTYVKMQNGSVNVKTTFRGKNAFGGVVTNSANAIFTTQGDLEKVVDWFE